MDNSLLQEIGKETSGTFYFKENICMRIQIYTFLYANYILKILHQV